MMRWLIKSQALGVPFLGCFVKHPAFVRVNVIPFTCCFVHNPILFKSIHTATSGCARTIVGGSSVVGVSSVVSGCGVIAWCGIFIGGRNRASSELALKEGIISTSSLSLLLF